MAHGTPAPHPNPAGPGARATPGLPCHQLTSPLPQPRPWQSGPLKRLLPADVKSVTGGRGWAVLLKEAPPLSWRLAPLSLPPHPTPCPWLLPQLTIRPRQSLKLSP